MFDLSFTKLLVLAAIALVIFGPNELPRIARQAGKMLRDLRQIAEGAKADLREGLGPEFQDFDFQDLNPKAFVQKHLLDDPEPASPGPANAMAAITQAAAPEATASAAAASAAVAAGTATLAPAQAADSQAPVAAEPADDRPPFDIDAT